MNNTREAYDAAIGNMFNLEYSAPEEAIGAVLSCSEAVFAVVEATTREDSCRLAGEATRRLVELQPMIELAEAALDFQLAEALGSYRSAAFKLIRKSLK